jgi:hypothetical protein
MVLADEAGEKQLLINLADRDLISWESLVERFGETPEIEQVRMRREARKRRDGQLPEKASPFHPTNKEHDLRKGFLNQGIVTPSEMGLELEPRKDGEVPLVDQNAENATKLAQVTEIAKPKGQPGQGRPKNSNDKTKRKRKRVIPRTSAEFFNTLAWAENAQAKIGNLCSPAYLASLSKKNLRELTDEEAKKFESFKFCILCQNEANSTIEESGIAKLLQGKLSMPTAVVELLKVTVAKHIEINGKEPNFDVLRRYQAGAYAFWKGDFDFDSEEE